MFPPTVKRCSSRHDAPRGRSARAKYLRKPLVVQVGTSYAGGRHGGARGLSVTRERKSALLAELLKRPEMDSVSCSLEKHGATPGAPSRSARGSKHRRCRRQEHVAGMQARRLPGRKDRVLVAHGHRATRARHRRDLTRINYRVPQRRRTTCTASAERVVPPRRATRSRSCRPTRSDGADDRRGLGTPIPRYRSGYDFGTVASRLSSPETTANHRGTEGKRKRRNCSASSRRFLCALCALVPLWFCRSAATPHPTPSTRRSST